MPVLSWASTLASFRDNRSYSRRVCFPGSAVSILLEYFPTFSGSLLPVPCFRAMLKVVDRILGRCVCIVAFDLVEFFAFSLASFASSHSSFDGSHTNVTVFPSLFSVLMVLYIWLMCSCPDCWRGLLSESTAALFLVVSAMLRNLSFGNMLRALDIAASSAEYGFCSSLLPSVVENDRALVYWILIAPPIPTTPFRDELLTAMRTA